MASYTIAISTGQVAAHDKTLVANTADTITCDVQIGAVEVLTDGTAAVYFTIDNTVPTIGGSHCYKVPAGNAWTSLVVGEPITGTSLTVVQVLSAGTPVYSVQRAI